MSCVDISRDMATLLVALRSWPNVTFDELRAMPEWHQARQRGWILDSGGTERQWLATCRR